MDKIVVSHLKYKYPHTEVLALSDVSFNVRAGEFIGIIGPNGSGKSTLCQALVGLVPHFYKGAYGGVVKIDNTVVLESEVSELALKVGLVFQNPFTQVTGAKLTVFEEIAFGLENMGLEPSEMESRISSALKLLDIEHLANRSPFDLSGGQMQRMAIAGIVAMKPEVIVLDEPTSQLDPQGSEEVFRAIRSLSQEGMTVILVEHKLEKLAAYADRIALLHEGRLVDIDTPKRIFSREDLRQYGVQPPVHTRVSIGLGLKDDEGDYLTYLEPLVRALGGQK